MEPIFSLGIRSLWNELNHMPTGGVWWLNVESQGDAINLVNQTVAAQQPEAKVAVVSMSAKLKQAIKLDSAEGPEKIRLFTMPSSINGLNALRRDLMCSINPEHYFFILLSSDNVWENIPPADLRHWLTAMGKWTERNKCSLLFVNVGNNNDKQFSLLVSEHRSLSGLASLRAQSDIHRYDIAFWCNEKGVTADQQLNVHWQNGKWQIVEDAESSPQPRSDEKRVLSHIAVLEGAPALSENWQLFENNEQLLMPREPRRPRRSFSR
ncbi:cellulose biosynthesis protein BcsE [Cedecea neteri]|uniref:Cellulose biosynthesis protein BcsE n=1 Tax=Cedecea neteri TaxID=158822 RepID=A0A2X2VAT0_9ENTR|nr:cellulose biosynthesis protein BcsE [Cedecea neteri]